LLAAAETARFEIKSADISGLGESLKNNFCGLGHIFAAWTRPWTVAHGTHRGGSQKRPDKTGG